MTSPVVRMETIRKQHLYFVEGDERIDSAQPLPSVSGIAGASDRGGDGLLWWAVNLYRQTGNPGEFVQSGKNSMKVGQQLHDQIYEYLETGEEPEGATPLFGAWYAAVNELGVQFWGSELKVYHAGDKKLKIPPFGGTLDALGYLDDEPVLLDWKTTDQFRVKTDPKTREIVREAKKFDSTKYAVQLGGYVAALRDMKQRFPEWPQPTRAFLCYVFKDTFDVLWQEINLENAVNAFVYCNYLYKALKPEGGFYA